MTTTAPSTAIDFSSPEFQYEGGSSTTFCQILNPKGRSDFGFCITKKNIEQSNFEPPDDWEKSSFKFGKAEPEEVYLTKTPRLLILGTSRLFMRDRIIDKKSAQKSPQLFSSEKYNRINHVLYKRAWCFVLDKDNNRCHQEPLALPLSGAAGTSFSCAWLTNKPNRSGFIQEMEELYAQTRNIPYKMMGALFHAHCVYEPIIELKERGTDNVSEVSVVERYKKITIANNLITDTNFSNLIKLSVEDVKKRIQIFESRILRGDQVNTNEADTDIDEMPF
jgi:hypothetical protein